MAVLRSSRVAAILAKFLNVEYFNISPGCLTPTLSSSEGRAWNTERWCEMIHFLQVYGVTNIIQHHTALPGCPVFLPLWAAVFWAAHDTPWPIPQTCHVFANPKLCGTKQTPRLPAEEKIMQLLRLHTGKRAFDQCASCVVCTWASLVWLLWFRRGSWDSSAAVEAAFRAAIRICTGSNTER